MPPRDPTQVQLDFPVLVADLIDRLQLVGTVGLLGFNPLVSPVFIVGSRGLTVEAQEVIYAPAEIFEAGLSNPVAAVDLWDTGNLPAGDYDIKFWLEAAITVGTAPDLTFDHRNAADTSTLSAWRLASVPDTAVSMMGTLAMVVADGESFRARISGALTGRVGATAAIKLRPAPS